MGEDTLTVWKNKNITDKQWQDYTRLAWDISPALAVYLPDRYVCKLLNVFAVRFRRQCFRLKSNDAILNEIKHQVQQNPLAVAHIPEALQYLATTEAILSDNQKLVYMLTWGRVTPIEVS